MNAIVLPDVASENTNTHLPLDWVGMCGIAQPLLWKGSA